MLSNKHAHTHTLAMVLQGRTGACTLTAMFFSSCNWNPHFILMPDVFELGSLIPPSRGEGKDLQKMSTLRDPVFSWTFKLVEASRLQMTETTETTVPGENLEVHF